jgi:hypothetical protein
VVCVVVWRGHGQRIASELRSDEVQALIRLEVACRLALDALPELPSETEQTLREPVQTLCDVTGRELDRINPGWQDVSASS